MAGVIVADTSWIVALRDAHDVHHQKAVAIDDLLEDESLLIAAVTLAECLVAPAKLGVLDEAEQALRSAFEVESPDDTAPRRWALRRAHSGLRLPDAIVLETALHCHASALITFDHSLARRARLAGLEVLGLP